MSVHLITTTVDIRTCPRCGRLILAGVAEGLTARVDLTPIADESAVIRAGRWTFELRAGALGYRDEFAQRGERRRAVLAEHDCPRKPAYADPLF